MNNIFLAIAGMSFVLAMSVVASHSYNKNSMMEAMSKDIQRAVDKGIDPMVIRCAYMASGEMDTLCALHAAGRGSERRVELVRPTK